MSDQRYNGWANYETWNVVLWLDNDEGLYSHATHVASYGGYYADLVAHLHRHGIRFTGDGIGFSIVDEPKLCVAELSEWLAELAK